MIDHLVHRSDETITTFEREALLADIFCMEITLKTFSFGQLLQDVTLAVGCESGGAESGLKPLLNPALNGRIRSMHELCTNRAAIGITQGFQDLAQRHRCRFREVSIRCGENLIQIRLG